MEYYKLNLIHRINAMWGGIIIVIGTIAFLIHKREVINIIFLIFCISIGTYTASPAFPALIININPALVFITYSISAVFLAPSLLIFIVYLTKRQNPVNKIIILIVLILSVVIVFLTFIQKDLWIHIQYDDSYEYILYPKQLIQTLYVVYFMQTICTSVYAAVLAIYSFFKTKDLGIKNKMKYIIFGLIPFVFFRLFYYMHTILLSNYFVLPFSEDLYNILSNIGMIILIAVTAYAIIRYEAAKKMFMLNEKNRQMSLFFTNVAHEVKTPLTLIRNYLTTYIQKQGTSEELAIIKHNINTLEKDFANFLDFEKLSKHEVVFNHEQVTDLSHLLAMKIPLFEEMAKKKSIAINRNIEENLFVKIDPQAADRIIFNIIDNSIKYNKKRGEVEIDLKATENEVELKVKDTGIGIDERQEKYIYEPFYQISHKKQGIQGMGMGLSIVKLIVDDIDGKISILSKPKAGATFIIKLKKHEPFGGKVALPEEVDKHNLRKIKTITEKKKYSVLVVEDNEELLNLIRENMEQEYVFYSALNGVEALHKLKTIAYKPSLIISDIMMDKMDGFQFYKQIHNYRLYRSIPFIFLTAKTEKEVRLKALSSGAIDFIEKPFLISEMMLKVNSIIKNQEEQKNQVIKELEQIIYQCMKDKKTLVDTDSKTEKPVSKDINKALYEKTGVSRREIEIIYYLKQGYEYKEIAYTLQISINTVREYIRRIYKKCGINNRMELLKIFS